MPRPLRIDIGNEFYHVFNRMNAKSKIFKNISDFELFENVLVQATEKFSIRLLSYINMPNHFHLALYPNEDKQISKYMHWLTTTFSVRWHARHNSVGEGHLFQGRYKSVLVKDEKQLLQLFIYIERNALKANLIYKAEDWRWSSLWIREHGSAKQKKMLAEWPITEPKNYKDLLNRGLTPIKE